MKNAQADVESTHGLIESEFYDIEDFRSREDFFNMVRPNFQREARLRGR